MKTIFFTGKGDDGTSSVGEKKVSKDTPALGLLGSIDELNSVLGWCRVVAGDGAFSETLFRLQETLFVAQAEIGSLLFGQVPTKTIGEVHVVYLESEIKKIDDIIPPITKFVIPGGCELSSRIDIARAIVRRVERDAVVVGKQFTLSPLMYTFLNRFSSILFALARLADFNEGIKEKNPSYL